MATRLQVCCMVQQQACRHGKKLEDVDWKADGKTYSVRLDGRWVDVPEEAVLDGPNKEGQALVWTYNNRILCFMPGAGT